MNVNNVPSEVLERICDAHWNGHGEGVTFLDIYQHNAANHTLSGVISVDGKVYGFIVDDGDWGGTVVRAWGDPEDVGIYQPLEVKLKTFVPVDDLLSVNNPFMYRVYLEWRKQSWFREMEGKYNYDRHFQPGTFVESYYSVWASQRGLKTGYFEAERK